MSLDVFVVGFAVNGINNVNISSYERRYLLSSKDSSLVASFYDVAAGLTVSGLIALSHTTSSVGGTSPSLLQVGYRLG